MSYLTRRIDYLLTQLAEGKLLLAETMNPEYRADLERELREIMHDDNGQVILETCGPVVRSVARG